MKLPFTRQKTWNQVIFDVLSLNKHEDLMVYFSDVQDLPPEFSPRLADNDGQIADYGLALSDGRGIHVKVYDGYYKIHWDKKDPSIDPVGHLIYDSPKWLLLGAVAIDILVFKGKYSRMLFNFFIK